MADPFDTPGYRFALNRFPGDGVTTQWDLSFAGVSPGYISQDHVRAALVNNTTGVSTPVPLGPGNFILPTRLQITPPVPVGVTLEVRRNSPKDEPLLDYTDGALMIEKNLDTSNQQTVYAVAEMVDRFADALDETADFSQAVLDRLADVENVAEAAQETSETALSTAGTALIASQEALEAASGAAAAADVAVEAAATATSAAAAAQSAATAAVEAVESVVETADDALAAANEALSTVETKVPYTGLAAPAGTDLVGFGSRTLTSRLQEELYLDDYVNLAVGNNWAPAIQAATIAAAGRPLMFTSGKTYRCTQDVTLTGVDVNWRGTGSKKPIIQFTNLFGVRVSGVAAGTVQLTASVAHGTRQWTTNGAATMQAGMLIEIVSSQSWYHDPRPESTDARKAELHRIASVTGAVIQTESQSEDGYNVAAETVIGRLFNPVKLTMEGLSFDWFLPTSSAVRLNGLILSHMTDYKISDVSVNNAAACGFGIHTSYSGVLEKWVASNCNNFFTGYGVQTVGAAYLTIRDGQTWGCRKGVDNSGFNTPSRHITIENNWFRGGGTNSDGVPWGYYPNGNIGGLNYGIGGHGPAQHIVIRGNTLETMYFGINPIGRDYYIVDNLLVGRFRAPLGTNGGENYFFIGNRLVDGWTTLKNGTPYGQVSSNVEDFRAMMMINIGAEFLGGRLVVRDNYGQVQNGLLNFQAAMPGVFADVSDNRVECTPRDNTTIPYTVQGEVPFTATGWRVSNNQAIQRRGSGTRSQTLVGITMSAGQLNRGAQWADSYTPTVVTIQGPSSVTPGALSLFSVNDRVVSVDFSATVVVTTPVASPYFAITPPVATSASTVLNCCGQAVSLATGHIGECVWRVAPDNTIRVSLPPNLPAGTYTFRASCRYLLAGELQ